MSPVRRGAFTEVIPGVWSYADSCQVYLVVAPGGREAIAIDVGSGAVLDHLAELGIARLSHVLVTHHHRDQIAGAARARASGARLIVPRAERDLIERVDEMWLSRTIDCYYSLREDRFSLLEPVDVDGVALEHRWADYGGVRVFTLPTPGHTPGSVSYLIDTPQGLLACTGDLIAGPGRVHSLAAIQWSYTGVEGARGTAYSAWTLRDFHDPDAGQVVALAPSHGEVIRQVPQALDLLGVRMEAWAEARLGHSVDFAECYRAPYEVVSEHLLRNRSADSPGWVVRSRDGAALFVDFGYDLTPGTAPGGDRAVRAPRLGSLDALRRDHGVERIEVAVVTHYHDDHVAGLNVLREVEGTEIWVPRSAAAVLAAPHDYDLPCLWWDPVSADRVLELGEVVQWHEYEIRVHRWDGHTPHAAAYEMDIDGRRVLFSSDLLMAGGRDGEIVCNFQYRNGFAPDDFARAADVVRLRGIDVLATGHWGAWEVDEPLLDRLDAAARSVETLHRDLLDPGESVEAVATITPYRSRARVGEPVELTARVRHVAPGDAWMSVEWCLPLGWSVEPGEGTTRRVESGGVATARAVARATTPGRRQRVGIDLTIGGQAQGIVAEALIDVMSKEAVS